MIWNLKEMKRTENRSLKTNIKELTKNIEDKKNKLKTELETVIDLYKDTKTYGETKSQNPHKNRFSLNVEKYSPDWKTLT